MESLPAHPVARRGVRLYQVQGIIGMESAVQQDGVPWACKPCDQPAVRFDIDVGVLLLGSPRMELRCGHWMVCAASEIVIAGFEGV